MDVGGERGVTSGALSPAWPAWAVGLVMERESARLGMREEGRKHAEGRGGCGLMLGGSGGIWPGTVSPAPPAFGMTMNTGPEGTCGQRYAIQARAPGATSLK